MVDKPEYMRLFERTVGDVFSDLGITLQDVVTRASLIEGGHNLTPTKPRYAFTKEEGSESLDRVVMENIHRKPDQILADRFKHAPGLQYVVSGKFFGNYKGQRVIFEIQLQGGDDYVDLFIEPDLPDIGEVTDELGCFSMGVLNGLFQLGELFYHVSVDSDELPELQAGKVAQNTDYDDVSEPSSGYKSPNVSTTKIGKVKVDPVVGLRQMRGSLVTEKTAALVKTYLTGYLIQHKKLIGF